MKNYPMFIMWICTSCFGAISAYGQCLQDKGSVFINEVGNTAPFSKAEFIELVVVGATGNPQAPVNLSDWIIDDSNATYADVGNQPGHIRLGNCFSAVPPGSIILLYTSRRSPPPGINPDNDGLPNADGVYQLTTSDACLIRCFETPTQQNSYYEACPASAPAPFKDYWDLLIPLRNLGDAAQVRNPQQELIHAVAWGATYIDHFNSNVTVYLPAESVSGQSIQMLQDANWTSAASYSITSEGTPGLANSELNAILINQISAGTGVGGVTNHTCYVCNGECLDIGIESPMPGFSYSWTPVDGVSDPAASFVNVCPTSTTIYKLVITDSSGSIIGVHNFKVYVNPN